MDSTFMRVVFMFCREFVVSFEKCQKSSKKGLQQLRYKP